MVIRAYLWKKARKDGKRNIKIYLFSKKIKFISTKYFIEESEWDFEKCLVNKTRTNYDYINNEIKKLILEYETKALINPKVRVDNINNAPKKAFDFTEFLQEYIEKTKDNKRLGKSGQPIAKSTSKSVRINLQHIVDYNKIERIEFDNIDLDFYSRFVDYLRKEYPHKRKKEIIKGLAENTISKTISIFVRVVNMAWKAKLHDNREALEFSIPRVESDNIALTEKEIEAIMKAELPKHLEVERDRFYVAYNFLLRFNDSINIEKADVFTREGKKYISIIPNKTQDRVIIPILPKTLDILKKYDYKLPKTTNQESNWKLKEIGRIAKINEPTTITEKRGGKTIKSVYKKHELITTHTTRRSMATNLLLNGFSLIEIKLMGGWKTTEVLESYFKLDKQQNAQKASNHSFFNKG